MNSCRCIEFLRFNLFVEWMLFAVVQMSIKAALINLIVLIKKLFWYWSKMAVTPKLISKLIEYRWSKIIPWNILLCINISHFPTQFLLYRFNCAIILVFLFFFFLLKNNWMSLYAYLVHMSIECILITLDNVHFTVALFNVMWCALVHCLIE